jgi:aldehyde dehydrogenase (NAD+)
MKIETGMIHVNDQSVNDEAHVPFGGEKASGIGRFNGEWAIDKFTTVKWIGFRILGLKPLLENKGLYMKQF